MRRRASSTAMFQNLGPGPSMRTRADDDMEGMKLVPGLFNLNNLHGEPGNEIPVQ